jgi:hypothetical protein
MTETGLIPREVEVRLTVYPYIVTDSGHNQHYWGLRS